MLLSTETQQCSYVLRRQSAWQSSYCYIVYVMCSGLTDTIEVSADNQTWTGADASLVIKDDTVTIPHETGITVRIFASILQQ